MNPPKQRPVPPRVFSLVSILHFVTHFNVAMPTEIILLKLNGNVQKIKSPSHQRIRSLVEKIKTSKQTITVRIHTILEGSMSVGRSILSGKAEEGNWRSLLEQEIQTPKEWVGINKINKGPTPATGDTKRKAGRMYGAFRSVSLLILGSPGKLMHLGVCMCVCLCVWYVCRRALWKEFYSNETEEVNWGRWYSFSQLLQVHTMLLQRFKESDSVYSIKHD